MRRLAATRRGLIAGAAASLCAGPALASDNLAQIESRVGGRLGVAALNMANGARLGHRADERFPMCSTFKAMAVAAVLRNVDQGRESLDRVIRYSEADLLENAPVSRAHVRDGGLRLGELCAAAIEYSDNTAANLILGAIGGPAAWTGFVRSLGDDVSRLDLTEPALNVFVPGDPRDTTTPKAMLADLRSAALGNVLSLPSRQRLIYWMVACKTGLRRLRAGLPQSWRVADKTGAWLSGGSAGDIAVAWAPSGPIVIACYLTGATAPPAAREAAIAEVGRVAAAAFGAASAL
jgi:beta-lactamase class A